MKVFGLLPLAAVLVGVANGDTLKVSWGIILANGEEILTASQNGSVVGSSCNSKLDLGDTVITVDADSEGNGNLFINEKVYDLGDEALCNGAWSSRFAEVSCDIPWDVKLSASTTVVAPSDCFSTDGNDEEASDLLPFMNEEGIIEEEESVNEEDADEVELFEIIEENVSVNPEDPGHTGLVERQLVPTCSWRIRRQRRNPADPYKFTRHRQLTDNLNCNGNTGCSTSHGQTYSVTHGAIFSTSGLSWISAGYTVSRTKSSTQIMTCQGTKGQRICVKNWRRYQRYNVQQTEELFGPYGNSCGSKKVTNYRIRSPMSHNKHTEFYCGRGTSECTWKDRKGWRDNGKGTWG